MFLQDRLVKGFIAGVASGITMDIYDYASQSIMGHDILGFRDWSEIMIYGTRSHNLAEIIFALAVHWLLTGVLGIVFAFLVPQIRSTGYLFKGWLFGVLSWLIVYSATVLFKIPGTVPLHLKTALSNFVGASIYGFILAIAFIWLHKRVMMKT